MRRILVTGSRDWRDGEVVRHAILDYLGGQSVQAQACTLVSGACPTGADRIAETACNLMDMSIERHPAQWRRLDGSVDKSAGYRRNAEMVNLGADVCLAFILNGSPGATHTLNLAREAGIPCLVYREDHYPGRED